MSHAMQRQASAFPAKSTAYAAAVLAESSLQFYWKMDETSGTSLADHGGSHPMTLHGGATPGVSGPPRFRQPACAFDGASGYGSVALNLSTYAVITVMHWLYLPTYTNNDALALEFTPDINVHSGGFYVDTSTGGGVFNTTAGDPGSYKSSNLSARPSAPGWHHYSWAIDRSANAITPIIDGVAAAYTPYNTMSGLFANDTLFVMARGGVSLFCGGAMAHLAIFSSDISADVPAIYAAGL